MRSFKQIPILRTLYFFTNISMAITGVDAALRTRPAGAVWLPTSSINLPQQAVLQVSAQKHWDWNKKGFRPSHLAPDEPHRTIRHERTLMPLKNKVAIVTGGNSGIGQAIVLELTR